MWKMWRRKTAAAQAFRAWAAAVRAGGSYFGEELEKLLADNPENEKGGWLDTLSLVAEASERAFNRGDEGEPMPATPEVQIDFRWCSPPEIELEWGTGTSLTTARISPREGRSFVEVRWCPKGHEYNSHLRVEGGLHRRAVLAAGVLGVVIDPEAVVEVPDGTPIADDW